MITRHFQKGDAASYALYSPCETYRYLEDGLAGVPSIPCSPEQARRLRHGVPVQLAAHAAAEGQPCWAACEGRAIAIGMRRGDILHPTRVFAHPSHPSRTSWEQTNSHPDQGAAL
ncbi:MAG: tRNA pseudouridine(55) synthase TruB [Rhodobacteraceae bacterium]|nr:tRNA pseudouridine(55) synthase TruB [Paracoccaceae bacterium]